MTTKMKPSPSAASNSIGQRLKFEMKKRGVTSAELAKRADVKTSFIYDVISGKSANPSTIKLARVAESLGVSLAYLAGSSARATDDTGGPAQGGDYIAIPRLALDTSGNVIKARPEDSESMLFASGWIKKHLEVNPSDLRLFGIRGDNMQPTLNHADTVLIDLSNTTPAPPGIFIISDGYGLTPKRLEYASGQTPAQVRVMSDNPKYMTYERSPDEILIIGRVVWFSRAM